MIHPAHMLASLVLEGETAKDFLKRHPGRILRVVPDPAHERYLQIPVFSYKKLGRYVNLFKPKTTNPEAELKRYLRWLVQNRRGYRPGDLFATPHGNFRITDTLSVEEA